MKRESAPNMKLAKRRRSKPSSASNRKSNSVFRKKRLRDSVRKRTKWRAETKCNNNRSSRWSSKDNSS